MQRIRSLSDAIPIFNRKFHSVCLAQLLFGILVGSLIGLSAKYEYEWNANLYGDNALDNELSVLTGDTVDEDNDIATSSIYIRCIVIVYKHRDKKSRKNFTSIAIENYFGSSAFSSVETLSVLFEIVILILMAILLEELQTVYVNSWQTAYYWNFYGKVLKYVSSNLLNEVSSENAISWTVIGDERMYVVVENLRKYLTRFDRRKPILIGRVTITRNLLSYLFPFGRQSTIMSLKAGMIFSDEALKLITKDDTCDYWAFPRSTEKAIIKCASSLNIRIVDPTDKDGMYLMHSKSPKDLIPTSSQFTFTSLYKKTNVKVECCSDEAITFGDMNYKQLRMIDFFTKAKVFGIS
ncbi:unnamed protein product [Anisakis simplex]|uniref:O-fucosyltransferase family protein n=1 Tax=Anisakis simplex TaxID=6269 RepID=A0A0M3K239_ANISI|nr:unnamed protein product [Anisakis simplex]